MLVIRRRQGEALLLGPDIELSVLEITPSRVTIGVSAPREIVVLRREVAETREANKAASHLPNQGVLGEWAARLRNPRQHFPSDPPPPAR